VPLQRVEQAEGEDGEQSDDETIVGSRNARAA
jgi:hypothetical protein